MSRSDYGSVGEINVAFADSMAVWFTLYRWVTASERMLRNDHAFADSSKIYNGNNICLWNHTILGSIRISL